MDATSLQRLITKELTDEQKIGFIKYLVEEVLEDYTDDEGKTYLKVYKDNTLTAFQVTTMLLKDIDSFIEAVAPGESLMDDLILIKTLALNVWCVDSASVTHYDNFILFEATHGDFSYKKVIEVEE